MCDASGSIRPARTWRIGWPVGVSEWARILIRDCVCFARIVSFMSPWIMEPLVARAAIVPWCLTCWKRLSMTCATKPAARSVVAINRELTSSRSLFVISRPCSLWIWERSDDMLYS